MKCSNLCLKEEVGNGMDATFKPLCHPCFTVPLTTDSFFAHGVMQWVIILLSVNLIPLLPTGVLGSSAANKEHISREDKVVEKGKMAGIQRVIKAELQAGYKIQFTSSPKCRNIATQRSRKKLLAVSARHMLENFSLYPQLNLQFLARTANSKTVAVI